MEHSLYTNISKTDTQSEEAEKAKLVSTSPISRRELCITETLYTEQGRTQVRDLVLAVVTLMRSVEHPSLTSSRSYRRYDRKSGVRDLVTYPSWSVLVEAHMDVYLLVLPARADVLCRVSHTRYSPYPLARGEYNLVAQRMLYIDH